MLTSGVLQTGSRAIRVFLTPMLILIALFPGVIVSGCSTRDEGAKKELVLYAGAATKPATDEAIEAFQSKYKATVLVTYGGSGTVLSQMMMSRAGDLYLPGSQDYMDKAEEKGVVLPETRRIVCYLVPCISVPKGNPKGIRELRDLAKPGIKVGIGEPKTVCLGDFALEIFKSAGLEEQIMKNVVVHAKSCSDVANLVILKQVDAAIGWDVFERWNPMEIESVPLRPEEITKTGNVPIAISKYTSDRELAQKFVDFLTSEEGKAIYAKHGYSVVEPKRAP